MNKELEELEQLIKAVSAVNDYRQARIKMSGIDLSSKPLSKKDVIVGETVFDHLGRIWKVGKRKKMIPTFSITGIMGVQDEITEGKEYDITVPEERDWGWTSDDIACWRRSLTK